MLEFIILILTTSIFLYALLAGADFGAGILQMLPLGLPRQERVSTIGHAVGPVWEANHIWLILALVIMFNGFPKIFWFASEWFHFPLGALVIGIIFRGASFTFLHYDPIKDKSEKFYHWIFGLSSLWCTLWLGIIIGSLMLGNFSLDDQDIYSRYFGHWLNPFAFSMGVFATMLMMFNASLFLYAEVLEHRERWRKVTARIFIALVISGFIVHLNFFWQSPERWKFFFLNTKSLIFIFLSFMLLIPQYILIQKGLRNTSRLMSGAQLFLIMAAGFAPLFPKIVYFRDGSSLDLYTAAAEPAVLRALGFALIFGCLFILPAYFYLMRIFKGKHEDLTTDIHH